MLLHGAVTSPLTRAVLLRGLWHQVAYVVVWIPASVSRAESLVNPTMKGVDVVTMGSFTAFFLQAAGLINFCIFMCVRACVGCALCACCAVVASWLYTRQAQHLSLVHEHTAVADACG